MTNEKKSSDRLTKQEHQYLLSLIDKEITKFEEQVEDVDEIGDTEGDDDMKEAERMLKMLRRIRFVVIDLDK
jgi:hypothetical protein